MTFMDSSGAAFVILLADDCRRRGGDTVLRGASERDLFVLGACGALDLFRLDASHRCPPPGRGDPTSPRFVPSALTPGPRARPDDLPGA